jgi:hypothetical protein
MGIPIDFTQKGDENALIKGQSTQLGSQAKTAE